MTQTALREFAIDNASILFLSLMRPYHTNSFRFTALLKKPVDPSALQEAVNRIHRRFPSVVAGLRQDFFHFRQIHADAPPAVREDPGLLHPMSVQELRRCGFRVFYREKEISIEVFHALTDGFGAIATLTALLAEYLRIRGDQDISFVSTALTVAGEPQIAEVTDSYTELAHIKPRHLPSRFSYLPARPDDADWQVRASALTLETKKLLDAAHRHGVTLNTLLTTVLADSVMTLQRRERGQRKLKPVRIMVPVNLRKLIGSRTLRNFSLYTLPTMEAAHSSLSTSRLCSVIDDQMRSQLSPENLSAMASYNVRTQNSWLFRHLPWKVKSAALKLGYRFFGESNSSLTLTNLGVVKLPEALAPYVSDIQCFMTPRVTSPYGCTVLSYEDRLTLNMCRFCPTDELGDIFFGKIKELIQ